ncbi:phosphoribosylamine--glycine ligase [Erysipelothrix urinaevulpis]|uniref:phosphoribosylamine--glycine ligase n=1 Tax=Erysipelothrix urinaevulpis TaxID=2683717 RepID=UPI00135B208A|nr:phosphoribosylamine--glycine ligase [Erysipelothrix urinaevulpis]
MRILVLGSGGREHALTWKLEQSPFVDVVYCCPGNGGIKNSIPGDLSNFSNIRQIVTDLKIDLTIVGPEDPLAQGIVDDFHNHGLRIFGVNQQAAQLEASKAYSKDFMNRYGIKTAKHLSFNDASSAYDYCESIRYPHVIKADGLYKGKGVIIVESKEHAHATLDELYIENPKQVILFEDYLIGQEQSLICFVSNNKIIPLGTARDYKKRLENDQGLNTGGVGAYSPARSLPSNQNDQINNILRKIENGFVQEKILYNGILFIGFMIDDMDVYVLEFNARFGDPETQVLLARLQSDLLTIIEHCLDGTLTDDDIIMNDTFSLITVLMSKGYPDSFDIDKKIVLEDQGIVFHSGTKWIGQDLVTSGGRVLGVLETGHCLSMMHTKSLLRIEKIVFDGKQYRKDIGQLL